MTDAELDEIEDRSRREMRGEPPMGRPSRGSAANDVPALLAEVRRYRAFVRTWEWRPLDGSSWRWCPLCIKPEHEGHAAGCAWKDIVG